MNSVATYEIEELMRKHKNKEALTKLQEALKSHPSDEYLLILEANLLSKDPRTEQEAEKLFEYLAINCNSYKAQIDYGKYWMKKRNYEKSKEMLLKATKSPHRLYAYEQLGRLEMSFKHNDEARMYFSKLTSAKKTKESPANIEKFRSSAMLEIAKIDISEGKREVGENRLKGLLKTECAGYANLELGKLYKSDNKLLLAENYFKDALSTNVKYFAMYEIGQLHELRGNTEEAQKLYQKIIDDNDAPNKYDAYYSMALIHKKQENYDLAMEELDISYNLKRNEIIKIEKGKIEIIRGNYTEAKKHFESVEEGNYKAISIYYLLIVLIKEERHLIAYGVLEEAVLTRQINRYLQIKDYLRYKLKAITDEELLKRNNYMFNQLVDYNKEAAMSRISLNKKSGEVSLKYPIFDENVDLEELYGKCQKLIDGAVPYALNIVDKYIIDLKERVGSIRTKSTTKVMVTTLPNTDKIINIYPVNSFEIEKEEKEIEEEVQNASTEDRREEMIKEFEDAFDILEKEGINEIDDESMQDAIIKKLVSKLWPKQ